MRISDWSSDVCSSDLAWGCWRRATAARDARALIRRFAPPSPATQEKGCFSGVRRLRAGRRVGPQPLLDRGAIAGAQQGGRACAQLAQVAGPDGVAQFEQRALVQTELLQPPCPPPRFDSGNPRLLRQASALVGKEGL